MKKWNLQTKLSGEIFEVIKNTPIKFQHLFLDHELSGKYQQIFKFKKKVDLKIHIVTLILN